MKQRWRNAVNRLQRDCWQDRDAAGRGPVVSRLRLSRARRREGPFLVSAWGYQPTPGERGLWCQPWGRLLVEAARWERDSKEIVETLFSVRSHAELLAVDSDRFVVTKEVDERGFFDRNMAVSVDWYEPDELDVQPLKGADRSAVGVWELGRSIAIEKREGRVRLQISSADFAAMVDDLLSYSAVVSSHKLPKALSLLADQGVVFRKDQ